MVSVHFLESTSFRQAADNRVRLKVRTYIVQRKMFQLLCLSYFRFFKINKVFKGIVKFARE